MLQARFWQIPEDERCIICPRLKKNILSISTLDAKGIRVAFVDGQVLMWPKGKTIDDATVIGEQEGVYTN